MLALTFAIVFASGRRPGSALWVEVFGPQQQNANWAIRTLRSTSTVRFSWFSEAEVT